jgi:tripartite-type tricarboxylate transporter receptor subunit TctC
MRNTNQRSERRRLLVQAGVAALSTALPWASQAQTGASAADGRPLQLVVPVPPGGSVDLTARLLAEHLPALLGQTVLVENRAGASGSIAAASVARAAGDPNTLMLVFDSHATNALVYPQLGYDTQRDFTPISQLLSFPLVYAVPASLPVGSMAEFIALARRQPGRLNYSTAGLGTLNHLAVELFKQRTGTHLVHIPYRGGAAALQAVMNGDVQLFAGSWVAIGPQVRAGRVKVLGVSSARRSSVTPELPTLQESGVPDYDVSTWIGALAPAGIGAARQQALHEAVLKALGQQTARQTLTQQGLEWVGSSPAEFGQMIQREQQRWKRLVIDQSLQLS